MLAKSNQKTLTITKVQSALENHNATLNYTDDSSLDIPIHFAVKQNHQGIVEQLIKRAINVNIRDVKDRQTALHLSAAQKLPNITKLLLENGADPDIKDINGKTPLHWACCCGDLESVIELLKHAADINLEDNCGATPITYINPSNKTWAKLQFHVVKLQTADMPVSKRNETHIKNWDKRELNYALAAELRRFENKAVEETLQMEMVPTGVRTSLADVLQMSSNKLSIFKSNEEFRKILFARDFKKKYPIYADLIRACYRKGVIRSELMSSARDAFREILGLALPDDCCDAIFYQLDNDNLHNLKESAEVKILKRKMLSNESIRAKKAKGISV